VSRAEPLDERDQLVDHVLPALEQGRVRHGVLVDAQRSPSRVGGGDDAEGAAALCSAEALLLAARLETQHQGTQPDVEHVRPVRPRRVCCAVAQPASHGHALELARMNHARAT
jgi:hypothetical protein